MKALAGLLLCLLALSASAEIAKWADAQGRVHYGDRPPEGGTKAELRGTVSVGEGITLVPAAPGASGSRTLAMAAPPKGEIWIYTTQRCSYCTRAKQHMLQRGLRFVEKDVDANPKYAAEFHTLGARGVPVTLAGRERINGFSKKKFDEFLSQAGF